MNKPNKKHIIVLLAFCAIMCFIFKPKYKENGITEISSKSNVVGTDTPYFGKSMIGNLTIAVVRADSSQLTKADSLKIHDALYAYGENQLGNTRIAKIILSNRPSRELNYEHLNINSSESAKCIANFLRLYKISFDSLNNIYFAFCFNNIQLNTYLYNSRDLTLLQIVTAMNNVDIALSHLHAILFTNLWILSETDTSMPKILPDGQYYNMILAGNAQYHFSIYYYESVQDIEKKLKSSDYGLVQINNW